MDPDTDARVADEGSSGLPAAAYRAGSTRAEELAAEDARAREAMGDSPYPAGDEDEV